MLIHETFQSTIQGEGFWIGAIVDFIRLSGCPVGCPWCDTGYADGGMGLPRVHKTITDLVNELRSDRVVISGGEPFIHKDLPVLVEELQKIGKAVHIETSGSTWMSIPGAWITLSPKEHVSHRFPVQQEFWRRADEIKIVVSDGSEIGFYSDLLSSVSAPIFLQPEWTKKDRTIPITLELLKANPSYRMSLQTHKYAGVQ